VAKHKSYDQNVFINCPFDLEYFSLLYCMVFTIVYFEYEPRISLESSDGGQARLDKISKLIKESRFGIHDLSRLQSSTVNEYYRLNMPFELGMDFALRKFVPKYHDKRILIVADKKYEYMKALSDINGMDIKNHENDIETLISCIRSWFAETVGLRGLNASAKIYSDFIDFNADLFMKKVRKYLPNHSETESERFAKNEIDKITMPEYLDAAKEFRDKSK